MRRVVKVGGSLLLRPRLSHDLGMWLSDQSPAETLIVVGGGELIDAIRRLDRVWRCDAATIHWHCVDLLRTTFRLMKNGFPDWVSIETAGEFRRSLAAGFPLDRPALIEVGAFYRPGHEFGLPQDWSTTTDSIAAALSIESSSEELVLLKSCNTNLSLSIKELASAGIVDDALPLIAAQVNKIRIERLPEAPLEQQAC